MRRNRAFFVEPEVIYGTAKSKARKQISVSGFLDFPDKISTKGLDESPEPVSIGFLKCLGFARYEGSVIFLIPDDVRRVSEGKKPRMWRNWQTRRLQVPVGFGPWRFDSSHPHFIDSKKGRA